MRSTWRFALSVAIFVALTTACSSFPRDATTGTSVIVATRGPGVDNTSLFRAADGHVYVLYREQFGSDTSANNGVAVGLVHSPACDRCR